MEFFFFFQNNDHQAVKKMEWNKKNIQLELFEYVVWFSAERLASSSSSSSTPDEYPGYDTKPSDIEAPLLEVWGMRTSSLLLFTLTRSNS